MWQLCWHSQQTQQWGIQKNRCNPASPCGLPTQTSLCPKWCQVPQQHGMGTMPSKQTDMSIDRPETMSRLVVGHFSQPDKPKQMDRHVDLCFTHLHYTVHLLTPLERLFFFFFRSFAVCTIEVWKDMSAMQQGNNHPTERGSSFLCLC